MAKEDKNLEEVSVEKTESSDNKQVKKAKEVEVKPYVHIDTFLQTARQMFDMSNMQAAGFKARMRGRHYQTDEQVFLNELKQYLDLK